MMKKSLFVLCAAFAFAASAQEKFMLWPEGKMPSVQTNQTIKPFAEWWTPKEQKSKAVFIMVSGGAYYGNSITGFEVAPKRDYFLAKGMNVVCVLYRTPRPIGLPKHMTAWQDAQRAVRLVRDQAIKRGLDPENIGFSGCSAGGHLTMMVATTSQTPAYEPVDELDKIPCHVNWAVPVYPAYLLEDGPNGPNKDKGNAPDVQLVKDFAFDAKTPPMCFFHGDADVYSTVGSLLSYRQLRRMNVPGEMHIMALEPHCFMRTPKPGTPAATWLDRIWEWMVRMDICTK